MATEVRTTVAERNELPDIDILSSSKKETALLPSPTTKRKYMHFTAVHSRQRNSCLSLETKDVPSFVGFRNLMVIVLSM